MIGRLGTATVLAMLLEEGHAMLGRATRKS